MLSFNIDRRGGKYIVFQYKVVKRHEHKTTKLWTISYEINTWSESLPYTTICVFNGIDWNAEAITPFSRLSFNSISKLLFRWTHKRTTGENEQNYKQRQDNNSRDRCDETSVCRKRGGFQRCRNTLQHRSSITQGIFDCTPDAASGLQRISCSVQYLFTPNTIESLVLLS